VLEKVKQIAQDHSLSMSQVALNYLLRKPDVSTIVVGARNIEQLKDNLATVSWELNEDELKILDSASAPPKPYPHWYFDIFRKERRYP